MTKYDPKYVCSNHTAALGMICPNCQPVPALNLAGAHDEIVNPAHYNVGGIETIDYMAAKSSVDEFRGHLRLTAMKYLSRAGHKDDAVKDYKKAAVYLGWLIKHLETGRIR